MGAASTEEGKMAIQSNADKLGKRPGKTDAVQ